MAGETVITIVGNLTRDPEARNTQNGGTVVNFSIASSTRTYDRQSNQWKDGDTLFMNCSAWGEIANHIAASLTKGVRVIAQGRLRQRSYQAKDGTERTVVEMIVDEIGPSLRMATAQVQRVQGNNAGYAQQQGGNGGFGQPPVQQQPYQPQQQPQGANPWGASAGTPDSFGSFGNNGPEPAF